MTRKFSKYKKRTEVLIMKNALLAIVVGVIITHYHFDHIGALNYFDESLILKQL